MIKSENQFNVIFNFGSLILKNSSAKESSNRVFSRSIVNFDNDIASLLTSNCVWKDFLFCGNGSFLRAGVGACDFINNCIFANVTKKNSEAEKVQTEKESMTTMSITESCHIEDSMNVLEGGIASGTEGSNSFMCNNCTFIRNERVDQRAKNTGRLSTTETQSFMNAEWNECSAPCGGALYVRDNSNAKLTIENSSFVKCNATMTRGGGIFALNIAECTVKHSTFVECYCVASTNYGGAGAELEGMRIQVLVENCLFKDGWSGNDGGGLGIWRSNTINSKDCILDCSFVNCNGNDRNSDGGGYISWSATDKVVLRNCLFQGCHSNFQGGAVSILTNGYNGNLLWFCFFHNNTAQYGNDIFVYDNNTHSQIVSCYSSRTEGVRYYADGDKSVWLPNNGGECRFVSSKLTQPYAKDTYSCGLNESCACLTISHCLTQMISGFVNEIKVLSGTVVEGKCVEISSGAIIIHGHSVSGTIAKTEFESIGLNLFSVENGSETVTDMSIIHDSSSVAGRNSLLFRVKGTGLMELRRLNISMDSMHSNKTQMLTAFVRLDSGEIKMNEVKWGQAFSKTSLFYFPLNTITSLQFDNCSFYKFLKASDGSSLLDSSDCSVDITMSKCVIDGCRSTISKKGGALKIKIGSAGCLKVDNTAVRNCIASTTAGRGGGIFMTVSEENADYSITASFTDNEARWGSDIFVDSTNLESTAKGGRISSLSASNATFNKIRGFDGGDVRVNIPLCVYLIPLPDELVVSNEDAFDHLYCGFVEFPCLTLKHTLERKEGEINICVSGMIKMADEVKMESTKCAIRGQTEGSGWIVLDDDNGIELSLVKVKAETLFEQLLFSLPSKMQKHNIFISVQSATILTMEECSASTKNTGTELSFAFMEVTSGTVNITQFSANSISLADFPLISLGGARTFGIIDRLEMDEASLTANCELINIQNSASMSVSNSRITGKKVEQRNLLLSFRFLSTISGNSVSLVNCSIKGFSSFEKNGGAIECVLESECSFEVVGGLMENSECIGRNGGGMCVEMKEGSWFSIGNVSNVKTKNEEDSKSYRNGATGLKNCTSIRSEEGNGGCGGGLCLLLVGNASDFFLKEVMFEECGADAGKNVRC
ncbi:uncharacterized protein MONOS_10392 [Monocercomonoides exilis]|uniref:uncharacterized protein n=1 Tax=Monocercomonoides exilis TaxID=2049356 RepID=UPI00355987D5|nr:hypothetical protein MONOS_10392 [Monocercomonoides exilis]|eukprot:MONOS_10392.1-p1 / transcript=MONOS_10392.1 / gene=MONOS_10392 / organism=Monocercomonoides_exilis_PA203 / gene_product=unspecified product / transcript_product=unspecified product / location=Mono_scaffold00471:23366-26880(-) / protein_length=1111 / sequence_SO=supercontig / SO=protein_coding / is_pseudo=false